MWKSSVQMIVTMLTLKVHCHSLCKTTILHCLGKSGQFFQVCTHYTSASVLMVIVLTIYRYCIHDTDTSNNSDNKNVNCVKKL